MGRSGRRSEPQVCERGLGCAPTIFESDESLLIGVRAPKIQEAEPRVLCLLDGPPKKEMHPSEIAETGVRASVLVNQRIFVPKREHGGYGALVFVRQSKLERVTKAIDEIQKPFSRRRRKAMALSSESEEPVELVQNGFIRSFHGRQMLAFGFPYLSLDRTLMKPLIDRLKIVIKFQLMEAVAYSCLSEGGRHREGT